MLFKRHADQPPYRAASALLMRWEDDVSVEPDMDTLEGLLRVRFRFNTDRWTIPSTANANPGLKLASRQAHRLSRITQAISERTKQIRAGLAVPARTIPDRTARPVPRARPRPAGRSQSAPKKTTLAVMRTGRTRMVKMVVPNRGPRARKVPAPRTVRERPERDGHKPAQRPESLQLIP